MHLISRVSRESSSAVLRINQQACRSCSTAVTLLLPLEQNSKLIFPVPLNRSKTDCSLRSTRWLSTLNKPSLATSVVGLADSVLGAVSLRPLCIPEIIRIVYRLSERGRLP